MRFYICKTVKNVRFEQHTRFSKLVVEKHVEKHRFRKPIV